MKVKKNIKKPLIRTPDRRVLSFGRRKTFEEGRIQVGKTSHSEAETFDKGNSKVNEFKGLYLFWPLNVNCRRSHDFVLHQK